ncbi:MAG: TIGR02444 family protein [Maricaulaceae bacterium]|jgi:uncharacterized protein (TIGR02444 family)
MSEANPPPLWDWAVKAYGRAGLKDRLLDLQNRSDADVCVILWCAWLDAFGAPSTDLLVRGAGLSATWRASIVAPLRAARNRLKSPPPEITPRDAETLRGEILNAELHAERLQLEALEAISGPAFARDCAEPALPIGEHLSAAGVFSAAPGSEMSSIIKALQGR